MDEILLQAAVVDANVQHGDAFFPAALQQRQQGGGKVV